MRLLQTGKPLLVSLRSQLPATVKPRFTTYAECSQLPSEVKPQFSTYAERSQLPSAVNLDLRPCWTLTTTWMASASKSAYVVVLLCARNQMRSALRIWSSSSGVLCYELTNTRWALTNWFGFKRCPLLNAHKYRCQTASVVVLFCMLTITWWALVNWSAPGLYAHKYPCWSASVVVFCCTLTNTWWALASWSASVGVLCWTLTIVASCFSRSCSTGPVQIRRKKILHLSLKMRYELKMGSVMKKLCLIFYWNKEESLE